MNPYSAFVMIYAIGFLASASFTMYALRYLREHADDDPENAATVRPFDDLQRVSGVRDSGFAIIAGLFWPRLVWDFVANRMNRKVNQ